MDSSPLEDDFSLGDIMQKDKKMTPTMKYILAGIILFVVLVSIIIIIIAIASSGDKYNDEHPPTILSKIAEINCTFDISSTTNEVNILNDEYQKKSKFYIFINGKSIPFSKKYKFENYGEQLVTFDVYEDISRLSAP